MDALTFNTLYENNLLFYWSSTFPASHHSWYIPTLRRRGTPCVCAEIAGGASFSEVFPAPSGSLSPALSTASAGSRTASHLKGPETLYHHFPAVQLSAHH